MLTFLRLSLTNPAPRSLAWLTLVLLALPWLAQAQCPRGTTTLSTQEQVDKFPAGCINFTSTLTVSGENITNLNGLKNLQLANNLIIENNPQLTSLAALTSLTSVGSGLQTTLQISNNVLLTSLDGLNKLQSVVGDFRLENNPRLTSLAALTSLTSVSSNLQINNDALLTSLDGLNKLQSVGIDLRLESDPQLTSLAGLTSLTSVGRGLQINDDALLTSLDGLNKLQSVGGTVRLESDPQLTSLAGLTSLTSVGGNLQISNDALLTSLDGLNKLQSVGIDLRLESDPQLISLAGLTSLTSVGNNLQINNDALLTNLDGLNKLQSVRGDLILQRNPKLASLAGLTSLTSVGANLKIIGDALLTSLNGLNKLQSVRGDLEIRENPTLVVCALNSICQLLPTKTADDVYIYNNAPGCNSKQDIQADCTPLAITTQPPSASAVCSGATVTATVSTTGNARAYQWYKGNQAVTGQTSATLSLTNVQPADAGMYRLVVSNSVSSLTSTAFSLTVTPQSPDYQALVDLYNSTSGPDWTRHDNWLTGCSPCGWYGVTCNGNRRVVLLNLDRNKLTGTLPASLSALTNLQELDLNTNQLSGNIPASLSALINLQRLSLYNNQLSGSIPASLSALTNLQQLILFNNQLSDSIPASLSALTNLQGLFLYNNQLSGSIPASLSALTNLQSLFLYNNQLSGCLPDGLKALCNRSVDLRNNPDLPGGGNFGAFCASGTGSDAFRPLATASPNPVCAGTPVSLSVTAGTSYAWSGPASFMANTQNPGFTSTTASSGVYSVTVGNGSPTCTAIATTSLTVNPLPPKPTLLTQSGQPYPGGQSTVSVDPNSGNVNLVVGNCGSGTLNWSGPNNSFGITTPIVVSTDRIGTFIYQATCTVNGCTSPAASATVIVQGRLSVLHRDGDNYADNNAIQPLLQLQNQGSTALPFSKLTLRYYLTVEGAAPLSNLFVFDAQVGSQNVKLNYVAPTQAGGQGYVEVGFTAGAGSLSPGANSGNIRSYFAKSDYSSLFEPDDYSYSPVRDQLTATQRITAYYEGVLISGIEPGSGASVRSLRALTESKNGPSATQISTFLEVRNEGTVAVNYSDLKARYYFTSDGAEPLLVEVDEGNVSTQLVALNPAVSGANYYLEIRYNQGGQLAPGASTGTVRYRISKPQGGRFDQSNDYSYQEQPQDRSQNSHVVVLVGSELVWGTPPAGANARIATSGQEPGAELTVRVLGNPIQGDQLRVAITGAQGQPLHLSVSDLSGRVVAQQQVESAGLVEEQSLNVSQTAAGLLLLQVSSPSQSRTVKVIKGQ